MTQGKLFADPMLEFPNAQGSEQEAFCAGERADRRRLPCHSRGRGRVDLTGAAPSRLGLARAARGFTQRKVADVVHDSQKAPSGPEGTGWRGTK